MKSLPATAGPPGEPQQLSMALDATTLHDLQWEERDAVVDVLAGLLLEAAEVAVKEDEDEPLCCIATIGVEVQSRGLCPSVNAAADAEQS